MGRATSVWVTGSMVAVWYRGPPGGAMRARLAAEWCFGLAVASLGAALLEALVLPAARLRAQPALLAPAALGALALAAGAGLARRAGGRGRGPGPAEGADVTFGCYDDRCRG